jgi:diguanylate cyclase (GGDEF)-like protein/PAS domain S-box-containing protein
VGVLVLLAFCGALLARSAIKSHSADAHAASVVASSNGLLVDMLDVETGQRGFLLTANPAYLAPYQAALRRLPQAAVRLRSLDFVSASPPLDALVSAKLAVIGKTIALERAGDHGGAVAVVAGGRGKRLMDAIRLAIARMQTAANATAARERAAARRLVGLAWVGIAMLVVGLCLLLLRARRLRLVGTTAAENFHRVFEEAPIGMALWPLSGVELGRFQQVNDALARITGYSRARLLEMGIVALTHPLDRELTSSNLGQLSGPTLPSLTADRRWLHADGSLLWVSITASIVCESSGASFCVMQIVDITARREAEERLTRLAMYDPLTELPNRTLLYRDRTPAERARRTRVPARTRVPPTPTGGLRDDQPALARGHLADGRLTAPSPARPIQRSTPLSYEYQQRLWSARGSMLRVRPTRRDARPSNASPDPVRERNRPPHHRVVEDAAGWEYHLKRAEGYALRHRLNTSRWQAMGDDEPLGDEGRAFELGRDQGSSDQDQTSSDQDQTASDEDQSSSDRDQQSSDEDQQAADADVADRVDRGRYDVTTEARARTSDERHSTSRRRDETGHSRLQTAAARDRAAERRDLGAGRRDAAALLRDQKAEAEPKGQDMRARAQSDRDRAGADRMRAGLDRERAADDRADAAADRDAATDERSEALRMRAVSAELLKQASTDQLTGARTRFVGLDEVSRELDRTRSRPGAALMFAFVDVDGLKRINDGKGHLAGDALLRLVGSTLLENLRPSDIIVRFGGDEFVCAMTDMTARDARVRFRKICTTLAGVDADYSVSFGLAQSNHEDTLDDVIARADADLLAGR